MGQKVNPIGLRLGINRTSRSRRIIDSRAGLPPASSKDKRAPAPAGSSLRARAQKGLLSSAG